MANALICIASVLRIGLFIRFECLKLRPYAHRPIALAPWIRDSNQRG